jgi:hypothetical protein
MNRKRPLPSGRGLFIWKETYESFRERLEKGISYSERKVLQWQ